MPAIIKIYLKKIKFIFSNFFVLSSVYSNDLNETRDSIKDLNEKLETIPLHICFMCRQGVYSGSGYIEYLGKYFHNEGCFEEYRRILEIPKTNYKYVKGIPVKYYE